MDGIDEYRAYSEIVRDNIKRNYATEKCNLIQKSVLKWQNNLSKTQICAIIGLKNATSCKNLP